MRQNSSKNLLKMRYEEGGKSAVYVRCAIFLNVTNNVTGRYNKIFISVGILQKQSHVTRWKGIGKVPYRKQINKNSLNQGSIIFGNWIRNPHYNEKQDPDPTYS